jgi:DNA-binding NarL/FixJ family response regulator
MSGGGVRVVVVDDEALMRSGIALILGAASGISVVGTAASPSAVALIQEKRPDVVLLDIRMPPPDGLTILSLLMETDAPPIVAMLTTFDTSDLVLEALHCGASGFFLKDTAPELLAAHVRALADGGLILAPGLDRSRLFRTADEDARTKRVMALGARDRTILKAIARGASNQQIAAETHLTLGTVKDAVSRIFTFLDVPSRVEAAVLADRAGLGPDRA